MVQGLMAQSGGGLIVKSQLGSGTTAELWLPVADAVADTSEAAVEKQELAPSRH